MKLPPATSFFLFFGFLLLINACETSEGKKKPIPAKISLNEEKAKSFRDSSEYDSAIYYQKIALNEAIKLKDTASIKENYYRSYLNFNSLKNRDSTFQYLQKLYEISKAIGDTVWMGNTKKSLGKVLYDQEKLKSAFSYYSEAKKLYLEINDTIRAGKLLENIAWLQKKQGNFGDSELSALEGLKYLENSDNIRVIIGLYHLLAINSKETGRYKVANTRIDQALELTSDPRFPKKKIKRNFKILNNTKANILRESKEYNKAIEIYNDIQKKYKDDVVEVKRVNTNLSYTIFLRDGFNRKSDSLLRDALKFFSSKQMTRELFNTYLKLSLIYEKEDKKIALDFVKKALKIAEDIKNKKSIFEALEVKNGLIFNKEDYDKYVSIRKENKANKEKLSYLYANERYDYNKEKNKKIKEQNARIIAENKISNRNVQLLGLSLFLVVLIVLTFLIYQRIKRRHKIEKVKTVHITEARISTKVHDELANDLYELMTQLETTNPEKEVVLDKLDTIYNQARDISKQIQSIDTDKGFADELSNLFRTYQSDEVNVLLKRYDIEIWKGISSHIKITVYRVLQELLTNMKKHSKAGLVVVSIERKNKQLFIQYIDNGKGFTAEISKNGLQNAENRIRAIKGKLTFDTELHKGCKFSINVPV